MCAEPVRNVYSDEFREMHRESNWRNPGWWGAAVVILIGLCYGGSYFFNPNSFEQMELDDIKKFVAQANANREVDRRARTVAMPAAKLVEEFQIDPTSEKKYRQKCLQVDGIVDRSGQEGEGGVPFVVLHGGDVNSKVKIECFFDEFDGRNDLLLNRMRKGQTLTVRGEFSGQVSNIQLRDCILIDNPPIHQQAPDRVDKKEAPPPNEGKAPEIPTKKE